MNATIQPGPVVAALGTVPEIAEAPGIHSRSTVVNGVRWALVRYDAGAERDEWCTDGHRGFVLHGQMAYELEGGERVDIPDGSAFWLPPGSGHRGVNGGAETQLFLIDVPDSAAGDEG